MIFNYINKVREKPEHIKRRHAFLISFTFSFMILFVWIASYGFKSSPVLAEKGKVNTPVDSLTASVSDAYNDIKKIFTKSKAIDKPVEVFEISAGNR